MRKTSLNRAPGRRATVFKGQGHEKAAKPEIPAYKRDPGTEGTVECSVCLTTVPMLPSGSPKSHAPGGYAVNVRSGRISCDGSGTKPASSAKDFREDPEGRGQKPFFNEAEARERHLVNTLIVAKTFGFDKTYIEQWIIRGKFVDHVAYLQLEEGGPVQKLFKAGDVKNFFAERGIRKN